MPLRTALRRAYTIFSPYPGRKYHFRSRLKNANVVFSARVWRIVYYAPREEKTWTVHSSCKLPPEPKARPCDVNRTYYFQRNFNVAKVNFSQYKKLNKLWKSFYFLTDGSQKLLSRPRLTEGAISTETHRTCYLRRNFFFSLNFVVVALRSLSTCLSLHGQKSERSWIVTVMHSDSLCNPRANSPPFVRVISDTKCFFLTRRHFLLS